MFCGECKGVLALSSMGKILAFQKSLLLFSLFILLVSCNQRYYDGAKYWQKNVVERQGAKKKSNRVPSFNISKKELIPSEPATAVIPRLVIHTPEFAEENRKVEVVSLAKEVELKKSISNVKPQWIQLKEDKKSTDPFVLILLLIGILALLGLFFFLVSLIPALLVFLQWCLIVSGGLILLGFLNFLLDFKNPYVFNFFIAVAIINLVFFTVALIYILFNFAWILLLYCLAILLLSFFYLLFCYAAGGAG